MNTDGDEALVGPCGRSYTLKNERSETFICEHVNKQTELTHRNEPVAFTVFTELNLICCDKQIVCARCFYLLHGGKSNKRSKIKYLSSLTL